MEPAISSLENASVNQDFKGITVRWHAKKVFLALNVKESASVLIMQPVRRRMVHVTVCQGG